MNFATRSANIPPCAGLSAQPGSGSNEPAGYRRSRIRAGIAGLLSSLLLLLSAAGALAQPIPGQCTAPPPNMVAWWPMDDATGSGTVVEIATHNPGTPQPGSVGSSGSPQSVAGKVRQSLLFNGTSGFIDVPNSSNLNFDSLGDFTIDAWVNSTAAGGVVPILDKRGLASNGGAQGYNLFLYNGHLSCQLADALNGDNTCSPVPGAASCTNYGSSAPNVADGAWHHIAMTVRRSSSPLLKLYVDAVPCLSTTPRVGNITNSADLLIGESYPIVSSSHFFSGAIDEVEIFNRALDSSEIYNIWHADSLGKCQTGTLHGCKWNDLNCNGIWDPGEPTIPGWTIDYSGSSSGSVVTDAGGCFTLDSLPAGAYTLCEQALAGWNPSYPATGCYTVTLGAGQTIDTLMFGNCEQPHICTGCGTISPDGTVAPPPFSGSPAAFAFTGTPNTSCLVTFVLPSHLSCAGGTSGLLSYGPTSGFSQTSGSFFDPNVPNVLTFDASGHLSISIGANFCITDTPKCVKCTADILVTFDANCGPVTYDSVLPLSLKCDSCGTPHCTNPPAGMVAWWTLDEQAGENVVADIQGGNNGSPVDAGGTWTTTGAPAGPLPVASSPLATTGKVSSALYFNGPSIRVPSSASLNLGGTGNLSIDAWIYTRECPVRGSTIIDKRDGSGNPTGYALYISNSGHLEFMLANIAYVGTAVVPPGGWHHVAVTLDRSNTASGVRFYIDGALSNAMATGAPGNTSNSLDLWIGKGRIPGFDTCAIAIDELEIFDRAIDSIDVSSIFDADSLGKCRDSLSSIEGMKFLDLNCNGQKDTGDVGLPGWTIFIDANGNAQLDEYELHTTTGADGSYRFTDLPPGQHAVCEVHQPGYEQSTPVPACYTVTLPPGQEMAGLDFGNCQRCIECDAGFVQGPNLVVNGDFSSGNTGFSSALSFIPSGTILAGQYGIRTDALTGNGQWCGTDHTSGTGDFMLCDGMESVPTVPAWSESVSVKPNTKYVFCAWVNNLDCPGQSYEAPVVDLYVNGALVAGVTPAMSPDIWTLATGVWYSGSTSGMVAVSINSDKPGKIGNDFGLDDISFAECRQPCTDSVIAVDVPVHAGWNMLSLPVRNPQPDNMVTTLFPNALSKSAFGYNGGYYAALSLDNCQGYWIKFADQKTKQIIGERICALNCFLQEGWNMIGTISAPIDVSHVHAIPDGSISSLFFGYTNSYVPVTTLVPGQAYWVKVKRPAKLDFVEGFDAVSEKAAPAADAASPLRRLNELVVADANGMSQRLYFGPSPDAQFSPEAYSLPPVPPEGGFDARFSSQRTVETYAAGDRGMREYTITLQAAAYPLTVRLAAAERNLAGVSITEIGGARTGAPLRLPDNETITLNDRGATSLRLTLNGKAATGGGPDRFALLQCYPNPFNPVTTIGFDLPTEAYVTLKVFNALGQEVATLINQKLIGGGFQDVEFDGAGLTSGIYVYRLTAVSGGTVFTDVKKMVLTK